MSRFTDNDDGSILDNETGLVWAKEDSWPVAQDWLNFQESLEFVDEMNKKDYLGFHDWRIPEREEIEKIFIADSTILARSNNEITSTPYLLPVVEMQVGVCLLINKRLFIFPTPQGTHNNSIRTIPKAM